MSQFFVDLQTSFGDEDTSVEPDISFVISTIENFANLVSNEKIRKISMVIVDNGHTIQTDTQNASIAKIYKFFQTDKEDGLMKKENLDETQKSENVFPSKCLQSRLVVFTDNFLGATQSNDQLVAIEKEFDRLKSIYPGNKVILI